MPRRRPRPRARPSSCSGETTRNHLLGATAIGVVQDQFDSLARGRRGQEESMPQAKKGGSSGTKAKSSGSRSKASAKTRASSTNDGANPVIELLQKGIDTPRSMVMLTNER